VVRCGIGGIPEPDPEGRPVRRRVCLSRRRRRGRGSGGHGRRRKRRRDGLRFGLPSVGNSVGSHRLGRSCGSDRDGRRAIGDAAIRKATFPLAGRTVAGLPTGRRLRCFFLIWGGRRLHWCRLSSGGIRRGSLCRLRRRRGRGRGLGIIPAGQPSADGKEQAGDHNQYHPNDYFPESLEIAHNSAQLTLHCTRGASSCVEHPFGMPEAIYRDLAAGHRVKSVALEVRLARG
jgi:hypothetical protein